MKKPLDESGFFYFCEVVLKLELQQLFHLRARRIGLEARFRRSVDVANVLQVVRFHDADFRTSDTFESTLRALEIVGHRNVSATANVKALIGGIFDSDREPDFLVGIH